jgi:MFS transporter, PAT family, beta-lactamase induction signal transducer AmpG
MAGAAAEHAGKTRKRGMTDVLRALGRPRVGVMLALGFSSGLPFMLIGNTLGFWLSENDIKLKAIGYLSWAGLAYLWKFIWGAIVDHLPAPFMAAVLGRRRGWMIVTQVGIGVGLVGMAVAGPHNLPVLGGFAVLAGIMAAMQDTVIDAWRIEIAEDPDELGLLTASYSLGFRIAMFATEALILLLATAIGWSASYAIFGALVAVGVAASVLAKEPARADKAMQTLADQKPPFSIKGALDAVVGPFVAFFRAHGVATALLMLLMITTYHLCDYMRGPMSNPYYIALGLSKPTIAVVRGAIGVPLTIAGIAVGGLLSVRLGVIKTLFVGAILQPVAVAAFALLGLHGGDYPLIHVGPLRWTAFETIMAFDSFAMSISGIALIGYMSSLTNLGYTATQYALLTSAMAWSGKILKGFSGDIVERLQAGGRTLLEAYSAFYLGSAAIGVPAVILCLVLANLQARAIAAAKADGVATTS